MEIILATNNANKVKELKRMLEPLGYTLFAQKEKGIHLEVEENGTTFEENAALKARAIHERTGGAAHPASIRHAMPENPATIIRIMKSSSPHWKAFPTAPPAS